MFERNMEKHLVRLTQQTGLDEVNVKDLEECLQETAGLSNNELKIGESKTKNI